MSNPPESLIDYWVSRTVPLEGETEAQRRVRAFTINAPGYERECRLKEARRQHLAILRAMRSSGDHSLEVQLFAEDLRAYAQRPSRIHAERLLWSTHNLRFTFGDIRAREIWIDTATRIKGRVPRLLEIRKRWNLPGAGDATHYFQ